MADALTLSPGSVASIVQAIQNQQAVYPAAVGPSFRDGDRSGSNYGPAPAQAVTLPGSALSEAPLQFLFRPAVLPVFGRVPSLVDLLELVFLGWLFLGEM